MATKVAREALGVALAEVLDLIVAVGEEGSVHAAVGVKEVDGRVVVCAEGVSGQLLGPIGHVVEQLEELE